MTALPAPPLVPSADRYFWSGRRRREVSGEWASRAPASPPYAAEHGGHLIPRRCRSPAVAVALATPPPGSDGVDAPLGRWRRPVQANSVRRVRAEGAGSVVAPRSATRPGVALLRTNDACPRASERYRARADRCPLVPQRPPGSRQLLTPRPLPQAGPPSCRIKGALMSIQGRRLLKQVSLFGALLAGRDGQGDAGERPGYVVARLVRVERGRALDLTHRTMPIASSNDSPLAAPPTPPPPTPTQNPDLRRSDRDDPGLAYGGPRGLGSRTGLSPRRRGRPGS